MTKEPLYSPLWTVGKKLCCLLEVQCQQRELSFISVPRNLRILAFGKVYIWAKNFKQPFWSVSFSGMLWLFFLQMLQNLKLKLLETRHDYVTAGSGNPEPVATACSGLGKKTVIHSQCSAENSWDQTFVSFHLFFDKWNEVTNSEAPCYTTRHLKQNF